MGTFLVTGACGYLAGKLIEFLSGWEGCDRLVGLDIKPDAPRPDMTYHRVDVRDVAATGIIAAERPDVLIHTAFAVDFLHNTAEERSINIGGLERVLAGAEASGCRQLIVTSSTVVYGAYEGIETFQDEDGLVCIHPHLPYARDKVLTEKICRDFSLRNPGTKMCLIRPAIVVGPHWANFWAAAFFLLPALPRIDGHDPLFQFVHEDDLAQVYRLCIEREASGTFNAADDGALTIREIARIVGKPTVPVPAAAARAAMWLLHNLRILPLGSPPAVIDFFSYPWVVSNSRAKEALGFAPAYTSRSSFEQAAGMSAEILLNLGRRYEGGYRLFHAVLDLELRRLSKRSRA